VDVEKIDAINAEPLERLVQLCFQIIRVIVEPPLWLARDPRLGGDMHPVPRAGVGGKPRADNLFRSAHAVNIGRVDMAHAAVAAHVQNGMAFRLARVAVKPGKRHRADPELRNVWPVWPERYSFHLVIPPSFPALLALLRRNSNLCRGLARESKPDNAAPK